MESMLARIDEELAIVKDSAEANIAVLSGVDDYVSILLVSSLRAKQLCILRMLLDLGAQLFNLLLVIIKAVAKMLFHVADFRLLREEIK